MWDEFSKNTWLIVMGGLGVFLIGRTFKIINEEE